MLVGSGYRLAAAPWIARTNVEQARLLLATGNHGPALQLLAAAAEITTRCGMSTLAADIRSLAVSHPEAATIPLCPDP